MTTRLVNEPGPSWRRGSPAPERQAQEWVG